MLLMGVIGVKPAAATWSTNEEERRKTLMSYLRDGVAYILWDNIARGSQISCPHIEKACTASTYSDRKLGVSEVVTAPASTVHIFTGNNIGPRGDLASRSLQVILSTDRPDPENRKFKHNNPVQWTDDNRAEIVRALYAILLGNPMLKKPLNAQCKTRFKLWWRIVGSALEHAAGLLGQDLDFEKLFLQQEEDEEESAEFFYVPPGAGGVLSPKSAGRQLKKQVDNPVRHGEHVLILKMKRDQVTNDLWYRVSEDGSEPTLQQSELGLPSNLSEPPPDHPDDPGRDPDPAPRKGSGWRHHGDAFTAALKRALDERGETVIHCDDERWAVRENVVNSIFSTKLLQEWPDADDAKIAKAWKETLAWALRIKVARFILVDDTNYLGAY